MELLAPAGNSEKLRIAYHYGADAAYIGGSAFNLRSKADNFSRNDINDAVTYAHEMGKKVYLTLNAYVHEGDMGKLREYLSEVKPLHLDGFIVSDPGVFSLLDATIPSARIHISTQANVTNATTIRFWERAGAKRVILARELTLNEIRAIRDKTDMELEVFVHGAVCVAYAGRCLLSNYLTRRDANQGDCVQVCRWNFKLLEEKTREGEYFPVIEEDDHTLILSSKDLAMATHLDALCDAGIDSIKIEGRMKSVYYVANVVRVYRKLLSVLDNGGDFQTALCDDSVAGYVRELETVSHRESDTGFFFRDEDGGKGAQPTLASYVRGRRLMAMVTEVKGDRARIRVYNTIHKNTPLIMIGRDYLTRTADTFRLFVKDEKEEMREVESVRNQDDAYIEVTPALAHYDLITMEDANWI